MSPKTISDMDGIGFDRHVGSAAEVGCFDGECPNETL